MFFDQYEFDSPNSEQTLELVLASPKQHHDLTMFLEKCDAASAISGRSPDAGWDRWEKVRGHLRQFIGLELPHLDGCREIVLICDDWNDLELAIAAGANLIWYHWSTSA